ncbi:hypothetical protein F4808DRAFT_365487 [Astrocystis sublimbata]|nr:hypothetical protein F4808DRAFT_365487 [Astrocystis sublimbata]
MQLLNALLFPALLTANLAQAGLLRAVPRTEGKYSQTPSPTLLPIPNYTHTYPHTFSRNSSSYYGSFPTAPGRRNSSIPTPTKASGPFSTLLLPLPAHTTQTQEGQENTATSLPYGFVGVVQSSDGVSIPPAYTPTPTTAVTTAPPVVTGVDGNEAASNQINQKFLQTTYYACHTWARETHCGWHEPILDASLDSDSSSGASGGGGAGAKDAIVRVGVVAGVVAWGVVWGW